MGVGAALAGWGCGRVGGGPWRPTRAERAPSHLVYLGHELEGPARAELAPSAGGSTSAAPLPRLAHGTPRAEGAGPDSMGA